MRKPLCIDLFCGMFGWGRAFAAEGWRVVGFDIEHLPHHGPVTEGCELVLQDVLTLHGSQFKDADCIVASPPCQKYSWLAMPWSRSKSSNSQKAKALRAQWEAEGPDNRLFEACFRIQREASEAAARYIPLVVENVRGAQEWVGAAFCGLDAWMKASREERWCMGRSAWNFGSFHLWGDVPALMPISVKTPKVGGFSWSDFGKPDYKPLAFNGEAERLMREGQKTQGGSWFRERNGVPQPGIRHEDRGVKGTAPHGDGSTVGAADPNRVGATSWFHGKRADPRDGVKVASLDGGRRTDIGNGARFTSRDCGVEADGTKIGGDWFSDPSSTCRKHGSRSSARKLASALIARIPEALASHIARVYYPR